MEEHEWIKRGGKLKNTTNDRQRESERKCSDAPPVVLLLFKGCKNKERCLQIAKICEYLVSASNIFFKKKIIVKLETK